MKEVIEISAESSHEEKSECKEEKVYINACDKCDFKTEANRRYISIQHIKKHSKEQCLIQKSKCIQCGERLKSIQEMKRHVRDQHGQATSSTSPPTKKKRQQLKETTESFENEKEVDEEVEVKDISLKLEDMEIDKMEDAIILAKRSKGYG